MFQPDHAPAAEHAPAAADHAADAAHAAQLPVYDFGVWKADLNDPAFWALVGLVIFLGIVIFMKVPGAIAKSLDARADKITAELAAAEALRREAEAKLSAVQQRAIQAEADARAIVEQARREATQLAAAAQTQLAERIAAREKLAEERIARAEADAVRDVKMAAVDAASKAAAVVLTEQLAGKAADDEFAKGLAAAAKALS
jgi:F-type H+-transporting ATPase subunit b